jgi:hypothetical protein
LICLLHIEEAQALPPRQGSSPWGGHNWQCSWLESSSGGLFFL